MNDIEVKKIFLQVFPDLEASEFNWKKKQNEYDDWDSFTHLNLITLVEEKFDISISDDLKSEGIAREVVNRVQNSRKEQGFDVTDRISVSIESSDTIKRAIEENQKYISDEVLANDILFKPTDERYYTETIETENDIKYSLSKVE